MRSPSLIKQARKNFKYVIIPEGVVVTVLPQEPGNTAGCKVQLGANEGNIVISTRRATIRWGKDGPPQLAKDAEQQRMQAAREAKSSASLFGAGGFCIEYPTIAEAAATVREGWARIVEAQPTLSDDTYRKFGSKADRVARLSKDHAT